LADRVSFGDGDPCRIGVQDDLGAMFQSAGALAFDLANSDNENMAIAQQKAQKVCGRLCLCMHSSPHPLYG
jgi:hypothetical protein